MKLEIISDDKIKFKLSFLLKDSDTVFANTLRRLIIEEVPVLAVEDLEIKDNSSALFDEMLGLRLGLLPITTDLKSYELKENCKCNGEGCARCELKINLKVGKKGYVYAGDAQSSDPKCTFVYDKMPAVKLLPKQKVDVMMTAVLGRGREHIKWSSGWAHYKNEPKVKLGKVKSPEEVAKRCSDGVFVLKNKKLTIVNENARHSHLLDYYATLDKGISVEYTGNLIFNVEGWGQLSCKEMLIQSAKILADKTKELENLI